MPVRTWCLAVATGLVLFTASSASYSQTYGQDANRAGYPQNYSAVSDLPFHVSSDTEASDPGCEEGHDDRKSDLCAQWKAADAAAESANVARVQFWIGSTVSALTLLAASAAAYYARSAAHYTASSVAVAENMGRLTNSGQTPAFDVRAISEAFFSGYPLPGDRAIETVRDGYNITVGPNADITISQRIRGQLPQALELIKAGNAAAYIHGRVTYFDIFREAHQTTFRLAYGGRLADLGPHMHVYETGNESD